MAFPKLLQKLFANSGAGPLLNKSILPSILKTDLPALDIGDLSDNAYALLPAGVMIPFAGKSLPSGWLLCNGAAVSRTTYSKLFAAIGTTWGTGNGSTTFNLPNCEGRFLEGTTDTSNVGTYVEAGLPNITGQIGTVGGATTADATTYPNYLGAFYLYKEFAGAYIAYTGDTSAFVRRIVKFAASSSSSCYSKSTVQPASAYALMIIKV